MNTVLFADVQRQIESGRLGLRTQNLADRQTIASKLCPRDQEKTFRGRWLDDGHFVFELCQTPTPAPAAADPAAMEEKDLRELAAERKVRWDEKASRETMNERVAKAIAGKR